jgi:hypothetical protein
MTRLVTLRIQTVCAALAIVAEASAGIVTFEGISPPAPVDAMSAQLTFSVDGFAFTNSRPTPAGTNSWFYYTPNDWNNYGGYHTGVRGTTAVYSGWYDDASAPSDISYDVRRADGSLWEYRAAWFTAVAGTGSIRLVGLNAGQAVFDFSASISNVQQRYVKADGYPGQVIWIDTLHITCDVASASGVRNFVMDDLWYHVPAPGTVVLVGLGGLGIRDGRRRKW